MPTWTIVSPHDVAGYPAGQALILDCRFSLADTNQGERDYRTSHLPGAHYLHLDRDLSHPDSTATLGRHPLPDGQAFAQTLAGCGWDGQQPVVVYDDASGAIAARAWWLLQMAGHRRCAVLDGGFAGWQAARLPLSEDIPHSRPHPLQLTLSDKRLVSEPQLKQELAREKCLLLDARAAERFSGHSEPIDARAGHIPTARNRPLAHNLSSNGRFKSPRQLHGEFTKILGTGNPESVIHMCGSGVTACHNLLAMEHAGLPGSRLFAASWSGWISSPDNPVATTSSAG